MDSGTGLTKATLSTMQLMAEDPLKCSALVMDDTCLGGLVIVLSNSDEEIKTMALQTLVCISQRAEHQNRLINFIGLLDSLKSLTRSSSTTVQSLAGQVINNLNISTSEKNVTLPLRDSNISQNLNIPSKKSQKVGRRNSMLVRGGLNKIASKTVVLQIRGLNDKEDMELCRNMLLQVRGVISITFNMKLKRSILRTKKDLKPELLAQAVARTYTMMAHQVVVDDNGQELYLSFGSKPEEVNKENEHVMPDYPEENVEEDICGTSNLARIGDDKQANKGWGFVKTVGDFLTNSFYW